jgi:hypothetical protein
MGKQDFNKDLLLVLLGPPICTPAIISASLKLITDFLRIGASSSVSSSASS